MINEVVNDPTSSFSDIAQVVNMDTALSARLLKIVNSSFYSFPSNIETVTHAIAVIGTEQLHSLALATTIISNFKGVSDKSINMNSFWQHSMGVAIIARNLAIHCRETNPERFYLAGILHDIGRLIILENLPNESNEILKRQKETGGILWQIEREILGFDHGEVGAALSRKTTTAQAAHSDILWKPLLSICPTSSPRPWSWAPVGIYMFLPWMKNPGSN
jgi:HD-like signal output (HDOD) protein